MTVALSLFGWWLFCREESSRCRKTLRCSWIDPVASEGARTVRGRVGIQTSLSPLKVHTHSHGTPRIHVAGTKARRIPSRCVFPVYSGFCTFSPVSLGETGRLLELAGGQALSSALTCLLRFSTKSVFTESRCGPSRASAPVCRTKSSRPDRVTLSF